MITRIHASVLALWPLIDHILSQPTTVTSSALKKSALLSTSRSISLSSSRIIARGLTEDAKIGVSIGVTFAVILVVGCAAILCVIRRRRTALLKPQTRGLGTGDINDDSGVTIGDDLGKGKDVYHMSPPQTSNQIFVQQAPNGNIYQAGGFPTIPEQTYAPQQQVYAMQYPESHPVSPDSYSGMPYPGIEALDPNQQNGFAGPSNAQYLSDARMLARQQQGDDISWRHTSSATSPVDGFPAPDMEERYLQDYQQQEYFVPPPRPDTVELPEQRKPVELMGEGHVKEVP